MGFDCVTVSDFDKALTRYDQQIVTRMNVKSSPLADAARGAAGAGVDVAATSIRGTVSDWSGQ